MAKNCKHDIIVSQNIYDYIVPRSEVMAIVDGKPQYKLISPIFGSMEGLPKLCVISSNHEATTDETYELVEKAKEANVNVTHFSLDYLCHVYVLLPFIPEAQRAADVITKFLQWAAWEWKVEEVKI